MYDQILFIQPYPFALSERNSELEYLEKYLQMDDELKCTAFKIVFYRDMNRRSGTGDLDDIEQVLNNAEKILREEYKNTIKEKLIEFCTYISSADWNKITHGTSKTLCIVSELCMKKYKSWCSMIEDFEDDYEFELIIEPDFLAVEHFIRVTDYTEVKGCNNIAVKYFENYKKCFLNSILEFANRIYQEKISEICFWDVKVDIGGLDILILRELEAKLLNGLPKIKCPITKEKYNDEARVKLKLDTLFEGNVSSFIRTGLRDILFERIKSKKAVIEQAYYSDSLIEV